MGLIKVVCLHCGAIIEQKIDGNKEINCTYCGGKILVDDGVYREEITETENININKNINSNYKTHHVDEEKVIRAKNERIGIIAYVIILLVLLVASFRGGYKYSESKHVVIPTDNIEITFRNVVLGKAKEKSEIIVLEQELSAEAEVEKEGLFNWGVFRKNKSVTFDGVALYTVNLKAIRENDIVINTERKTVTIYVPEVEIYSLNIDPDDITLGDTQTGLLSFGEIKFTLEESYYLLSQGQDSLYEKANEENCLNKASKAAEKALEELFGNVISKTDPDYRLIIEFY